jgi:hypothetical protein
MADNERNEHAQEDSQAPPAHQEQAQAPEGEPRRPPEEGGQGPSQEVSLTAKATELRIKREVVSEAEMEDMFVPPLWQEMIRMRNEDYQRWVDEDFVAVMQEKDKQFEAAVQIYKEYYDLAEATDRCYPHGPITDDRRPGEGVREVPTWRWLRAQHHGYIRALIKDRNHKLAMIGWIFKAEARRQAAQEGLRQHEAELKPCNCPSCRRYR